MTHRPIELRARLAQSSTGKVPTFSGTIYSGGILPLRDFPFPVIVDLRGLDQRKVLVANLDHDPTKRVGTFTVLNDGRQLIASGTASAATAARDEVIQSAKSGYVWEASIEANVVEMEQMQRGEFVVNGQRFQGPKLIASRAVLVGFAFVSTGADSDTSISIAASAGYRFRPQPDFSHNHFAGLSSGVARWVH